VKQAMNSFLLPIADVKERDVDAWRELARRAVEPNPFFEPEFVLPAAARLDDGPVALLVVARAGGEWMACMPVVTTARWKRLPVAAIAAWRHLYCFLGTPLLAPEALEQTIDLMLRRGLDGGGRARMLTFEWVRGDGPVAAALEAVVRRLPRPALQVAGFERASLERRPESDYLEQTLRPHHRRELRRLGRRLAEEMGEPLELRDRSHDRDGVEAFLALEAAGWKGRRETAFASRSSHAELFRELCDSFRAAGRLQLLALMAGDRPAALKCNLIAGDEVFCFKIAYDESLSRFSPGVQLEERMVQVFHEQMPETRVLDSCASPDNDMINRLWPDRRPLVSYAVPAAGAAGWASARGVEAALQIHNRTRRAS
jgi:CelD/BcsL family acetyltransferase involved in cellulose biosynthesis